MQLQMFTNILLNISILTIIAMLITGIAPVKKLFTDQDQTQTGLQTLTRNLLLAIFFGGISILSTYTGTYVNGAILNTRVIGVIAGGLIGGPVVGIGSALIAGFHRYAFDIGGFTALSCTISTLFEGILASAIWVHHQKTNRNYNYPELFFITFFAECMQMALILLIAKPFERAVELVKVIGFPMVMLNSLGVCLFFSVFRHMMTEQDSQNARRIRLTLEITNQCLPYLRKRERTEDDWNSILTLLGNLSGCKHILVTDTTHIVAQTDEIGDLVSNKNMDLFAYAAKSMSTCTTQLEPIYIFRRRTLQSHTNYLLIASPLVNKQQSIGCITMILSHNGNTTPQTEIRFVDGLAQLFADQIILSELEYQEELLQKAEYQALQAQINPHFLFNSLNTISFFCREKPERARELILSLSTYFRNTLQNKDLFIPLSKEMEHVNAYLDLEKARFEESLQIDVHLCPDLNCLVPPLIIQPIVENAVKHGAMKRPVGKVKIQTSCENNQIVITISDNGPGIPAEVLANLKSNLPSKGLGLSNVQKRLQKIYGSTHTFDIQTNSEGTTIQIAIPQEDTTNENCYY